MALFSQKKTYPSLVISQEKLQLFHLDKSRKKVLTVLEEKLAKDVIKAGEINNLEALINSLKKLLTTAKLKKNLLVVGLPENKSYTKILTLPKLKSHELSEAVTWEAETYLPIALDQVYMDWKIIKEEKETLTILLVAVPKPLIDSFTTVIKQAGAIPIAYETLALSLVRLVEEKKERALIVQISEQQSILTLASGRAIEASAIDHFTNDEKGLTSITETVEKMLKFYEEKNKLPQKVKTIYLCGEQANQQVLNALTKTTNRQVKLCPIPVNNLPANQAQNFALATSLALKVVRDPSDEYTINLVPPEIQEEFNLQERKKVNKHFLALTTTVLTLTTVASLISLLYLFNLRSNLEKEKISLPLLPSETGTAISQTQSTNKMARTIVQVDKLRTYPQTRIAVLLPIIPQGINIANISIDELQKQLVITGRAATRESLLELRDKLEETQDFNEAILPLSSLQKAKDIDFVLKTTIN